jgi:UDP-glucose 4-epimerase
MLQGERPIIYGTGEKRRDYVYVDDVNRFHLLLIEDPRSDNGVFNVGSGVNYSVNEVFNLIEGILRTGLRPIYSDDLPGEAQINLADITRARNLGWQPTVSIHEGIERSIEYIRTRVLDKSRSAGQGGARAGS